MIRIEEPAHWLLVKHQDHARLAGKFAEAWGNHDFGVPEPFADVLVAVARHDDAWAGRDARPWVTRDGRPAGFSRELVGSYNAFEDIDLADYLRVRGEATEAVAADNPYAAILVSLHTLNLLTEQADLSKLTPDDLALHGAFVDRQRARQQALVRDVSETLSQDAGALAARLDQAFRFLQACDSLSLTACVRYAKPIALRHSHPRLDGTFATLECLPAGPDVYSIFPYPFGGDDLVFQVPYRRVPRQVFTSNAMLREAYATASDEFFSVKIGRGAAPS